MFEVLREIVQKTRARQRLCSAVIRQFSLSAEDVVNISEIRSGTPHSDSVQTIITIIGLTGVRKYLICKEPLDITETDIVMLRSGATAPSLSTVLKE